MSATVEWLPSLVLLKDHGGDWNRYLAALYEFFKQDFIKTKPVFRGRRVGHKRYPVRRGKERTFWHLISAGKSEDERVPDIRRCERVRWPRPMIESVDISRVKCWPTRRRGENRFVVALCDFSYVVVLAERSGYIILWTAYCVEREHRRQKLRREWAKAGKS